MFLSSTEIKPTPIEFIGDFLGSEIWVKRDDLIDDQVSGNKLYKLIKNVEYAAANRFESILTFGGAYSNHIAATAKYGKLIGVNTIGFIRGEKTDKPNPTLSLAIANSMKLHFISRAEYRLKNTPAFLKALSNQFPESFIIPEGGANKRGIQGSKLILNPSTEAFDYIALPIGTGTTFAGLASAVKTHQTVLGFTVHRHGQILNDILSVDESFSLGHHQIINKYHFGGYAKWTQELIDFIQSVYNNHKLKLDPIYTSKAYFGLLKEIESGRIKPNSKILFIHTGGLQGVKGFEERFRVKLF